MQEKQKRNYVLGRKMTTKVLRRKILLYCAGCQGSQVAAKRCQNTNCPLSGLWDVRLHSPELYIWTKQGKSLISKTLKEKKLSEEPKC